jgi:hypothetical protein
MFEASFGVIKLGELFITIDVIAEDWGRWPGTITVRVFPTMGATDPF